MSTKRELQLELRAKKRQIREARELAHLLFVGILPKRKSFTHRYLCLVLKKLGHRWKHEAS